MSSLRRALSSHEACTDPEAADRRLRGRTYAIPFDKVWSASLALATVLPRWSVVRADDQTGEIRAEARPLFLRTPSDVTIRIRLDEDAQTRVDLQSRTRDDKRDFGTNARRVARFLTRLDRRLEVRPSQILSPGP